MQLAISRETQFGAYHAPEGAAAASPSPSPAPAATPSPAAAASPSPAPAAAPAASPSPSPAAKAAPSPSPVETFLQQIPDDIRNEAYFKDVKDVGSLAKRAFHQAKLVGLDKKNLVAIPGPDDAEGWAALHTQMGRPESADKYELGKRADGKEYSEGDKAFQAQILPLLHEVGLTQRQVAAIAPKWDAIIAGLAQKQTAAATAKQAESFKALRSDPEFGGAAYDQNIDLAHRALAHYADADTVAYLEQSKLGDHPGIVKLFAKLGRGLREDGVIGRAGEGDRSGSVMTPTEARQQIASQQQNKDFMTAYRSKSAPGHAEAVEKMRGLYEMAYPAPEAGAA